MRYNNTVIHLGLSNNKINGSDIDSFAESLKYNKSLLSIDLKWNELREEGGIKLLDAL